MQPDNIIESVEMDQQSGHRILTLQVDLDVDFGLSSSGRSTQVATSHGWQPLGREAYSLNVVRKKEGRFHARR